MLPDTATFVRLTSPGLPETGGSSGRRSTGTVSSGGTVHPSTLSDSLGKLKDNDLLRHPTPREATYRLTEKGHDLVALLRQVQAWGDAHGNTLDR